MKKFVSLLIIFCLILMCLSGCSFLNDSDKVKNDGPYTPNPDDFEYIDVSVFDKTWDMDSDKLGTYYLDLTTHDPSTSMKTKFMEEWCELIRRATDGGVNISITCGGTLASAADALSAAEIGTVDLAWIIGSNFADVLPATGMFYLPGLGFGDNINDCDIMWDMYEKYPAMEDQYTANNVKLIHLYTTGSVSICGDKIETLSDFKGKNIRTTGGYAAEIMSKLGASPISMGPGDLYDAMSKGVIENFCLEWSGVKTYRLYEVSDYYNSSSLWVTVMGLVMNLDSYNRLPEEYREVIDYFSGRDMSLQMAYNWKQENKECEQTYSDESQRVSFSDEEYEKLMAICKEYSEEKAAALTTENFDAESFLQDIYDDVEAHKDFKYYREETE